MTRDVGDNATTSVPLGGDELCFCIIQQRMILDNQTVITVRMIIIIKVVSILSTERCRRRRAAIHDLRRPHPLPRHLPQHSQGGDGGTTLPRSVVVAPRILAVTEAPVRDAIEIPQHGAAVQEPLAPLSRRFADPDDGELRRSRSWPVNGHGQ